MHHPFKVHAICNGFKICKYMGGWKGSGESNKVQSLA